MSASSVAAVPLEVLRGTMAGQAIVTDVPAEIALQLRSGVEAAFIGLALRSPDPMVLSWVSGATSANVVD